MIIHFISPGKVNLSLVLPRLGGQRAGIQLAGKLDSCSFCRLCPPPAPPAVAAAAKKPQSCSNFLMEYLISKRDTERANQAAPTRRSPGR